MYFRSGWKMCRSWERMWQWRMNCTSMAVESCLTSQSVTQSQNLRSSCELTAGFSPHYNNPWTNRSVYVCNHFDFLLIFFSRHKTISLRDIDSLHEDNMYMCIWYLIHVIIYVHVCIYMSIWDLFVKQFTSDSLVHVQSHFQILYFSSPWELNIRGLSSINQSFIFYA